MKARKGSKRPASIGGLDIRRRSNMAQAEVDRKALLRDRSKAVLPGPDALPEKAPK